MKDLRPGHLLAERVSSIEDLTKGGLVITGHDVRGNLEVPKVVSETKRTLLHLVVEVALTQPREHLL